MIIDIQMDVIIRETLCLNHGKNRKQKENKHSIEVLDRRSSSILYRCRKQSDYQTTFFYTLFPCITLKSFPLKISLFTGMSIHKHLSKQN